MTANELAEMYYAMRRQGKTPDRWVFGCDALRVIQTLKFETGAYVWQGDRYSKTPRWLVLGMPYEVKDDVPPDTVILCEEYKPRPRPERALGVVSLQAHKVSR